MSLPCISEWSYDVAGSQDTVLKWSPAGLLAVCQGPTLTILDPRDISNIVPIASVAPFDSSIGTVSWCTGTKDGQTPFRILVTSKGCQAAIYNVCPFNVFCEFRLPKGCFGVSSVWSAQSTFTFYIGDSRKTVSMYQLYDNEAVVIWSLSLTFVPVFLQVCQFGPDSLLVASKAGDYRILDKSQNEVASGSLPVSKNLSSVRFYPFLEDTLMFVAKDRVYFYMIKRKALTSNFEAASENESIVDVVMDSSNEGNLVVVRRTNAVRYSVRKNKLLKQEVIPLLSLPPEQAVPLLSLDSMKNQVALMMRGGVIQFMEFSRGGSFVCTSVYRLLNAEPIDFDISGSKAVVATENGYVSIMEDSKISRCFQIIPGTICSVNWLNGDSFIAIMKNVHGSYEVFFLDLSRLWIKNLLSPMMQKIDTDEIAVAVSKSKKFYALVIAERIILVYQRDQHLASIFEKHPTHVTFSDWRDEELLCVTEEWIAKKYVLSPGSDEGMFNCHGTRQITDCPKAKPVVAVAVNGLMLCGTDKGTVLVVDWYNKSTRLIEITKTEILWMSGFKNRCLVQHDKGVITLLECNDEFEVRAVTLPNNVQKVRWVDINHAMALLPGKQSISLVSAENMTPVARYAELNIMPYDDIIFDIQWKRDVGEISQTLRHNGLCLLSDLIESLRRNDYSAVGGSANFTIDRMKDFFTTIDLVFGGCSLFTKEQIRLEVLLDNDYDAVQMLCKLKRTSSTFAVDTMKAALVGCRMDTDQLNTIVSRLSENRCSDDAADLLLLCGGIKEASRLLLARKQTHLTLMSIKSMQKDDESDQVRTALANYLILNRQPLKAAAVKMAFGDFQAAAQVLQDEGYDALAQVIGSITKCSRKGNLRFS